MLFVIVLAQGSSKNASQWCHCLARLFEFELMLNYDSHVIEIA